MLLLQEVEFDIQHRPGTQHAVADYLSRLENVAGAVNGDDDFPDGAIVHIAAEDPEWEYSSHEDKWLIEMSTFLSTGLPPLRMWTGDKKRLVVLEVALSSQLLEVVCHPVFSAPSILIRFPKRTFGLASSSFGSLLSFLYCWLNP